MYNKSCEAKSAPGDWNLERLLVAQSFDRIEARRFARREEPEAHAHQNAESHGDANHLDTNRNRPAKAVCREFAWP